MRYAKVDADFIDYLPLDLDVLEARFGARVRSRSPSTLSNPRVVFLGAAQTFGRYAETPYPSLLHDRLGVPVLSLCRAGGGPGFWKDRTAVIDVINTADLLVYQITSARSTNTTAFKSKSGGRFGIRQSDGVRMDAREFLEHLLMNDRTQASAYLAEVRDNYVEDTRAFFKQVRVPTIALWFSVQKPRAQVDVSTSISWMDRIRGYSKTWKKNSAYKEAGQRLMGAFPHYVNHPVMEQIEAMVSETVYCVSKSGLPQILHAKDGSGRTRTNTYYPSPEMHREAADLLEPVCRKYLSL